MNRIKLKFIIKIILYYKMLAILCVFLTACVSSMAQQTVFSTASTIELQSYINPSTATLLKHHHDEIEKGNPHVLRIIPTSLVANVHVNHHVIPMVMDTGSSDIVVKMNAKTPQTSGNMVMIPYETSTTIVQNETFPVSFGKITIPKQTVGKIVSGSMPSNVFGLGFPALSRLHPSQAPIHYVSSFSYFISQVKHVPSTISFNTMNEENYYGEMVYLPVIGKTYWQTPLNDIYIDNTPLHSCNGKCMAIVDTGTTMIRGPKDTIDLLLSFLIAYNDNKTTFDCNNIQSLPVLSFELGVETKKPNAKGYTGTSEFTLEPQFYMQRFNGVCLPAFATTKENTWIFGETFLRKYYTVFDVTRKRMGFGISSHTVQLQPFYSQSPIENREFTISQVNKEAQTITEETDKTESLAVSTKTVAVSVASSAAGGSASGTAVTVTAATPKPTPAMAAATKKYASA